MQRRWRSAEIDAHGSPLQRCAGEPRGRKRLPVYTRRENDAERLWPCRPNGSLTQLRRGPGCERQSGAPLAATNVKTAGSVCKRRDAVRLGRKKGLQPRVNERPAVSCSEKLGAPPNGVLDHPCGELLTRNFALRRIRSFALAHRRSLTTRARSARATLPSRHARSACCRLQTDDC